MKKLRMIVFIVLAMCIFAACTKGSIKLNADEIIVELGVVISDEITDYVTASKSGELKKCELFLSDVDIYEVGIYEAKVVYEGKDYPFTVEVKDTVAPKASLIKEEFELEIGSYLDIYDVYSEIEELSEYVVYFSYEDVEVENEGLMLEDIGEFDIVSYIEDESGNKIEFTFKVIVVELSVPTFEGLTELNWNINQDKPDFLEGVTAYDTKDGDLTSVIEVDDSDIDETYNGEYRIYYYAEDSDGNVGEGYRIINISGNTDNIDYVEDIEAIDETIPVISGMTEIKITVGDAMPSMEMLMAGVTAIDGKDGNITSKIYMDDSELDVMVGGEYYIYYFVLDNDFNEGYAERLITVTDPTEEAE
jgi:hypothetical protein